MKKQLRFSWFVVAFALTAFQSPAQIRNLATTDDGREVVFFSYQRPAGARSPNAPSEALLRFKDGAWTVNEASAGAGFPGITGDGKISYWVRSFGCGSCFGVVPRSDTEFAGFDSKTLKIPNYNTQLSRNGAYALFPGFFGVYRPAVQHLESGRTWTNSEDGVPFSPSRIADDGTLLGLKASGVTNPFVTYVSPSTVVRWRPGQPVEDIFTAPEISGIALAASGKRAIVEAHKSGVRQFWLLDVGSKESRIIAELPVEPGLGSVSASNVSISADGNRALIQLPLWVRRDSPVYFWDESAGEVVALVEDGTASAMSHDGSAGWIATADSRLPRFHLGSREREEILGPFPNYLTYQGDGATVPGSAVRLIAFGPTGGVEIRLGSLVFPPVTGIDTQPDIMVQVPWELSVRTNEDGSVGFQVAATKIGHPLELPFTLPITNRLSLRFDTYQPQPGVRFVRATAGDATVTVNRPARPGETVRVWMTGLGPLDRDVPTGAPGPDDPVARPRDRVACAIMGQNFVNPPWQGVEVSPVAYAPGKVGLYQLDLKIPDDWPAGLFNLACYRDGTRDRGDALIPVGR